MQVCAEVEAVIGRARALFGPASAVQVPDAGGQLQTAAGVVSAARSRTADLRGAGIQGYQASAGAAVPALQGGARTDTTLAGHLGAAAAVNQAGSARMEHIAAATAAITKVAPAAVSAPSQRMVLAALRTQVSQAGQVVGSTEQHSAAMAEQVRTLTYPKDSVQGLGGDVPQSPARGDEDPPHGQDPRYWVDVTKVIHVPPGQLAPADTVQIGPGLYYPLDDQQYNVTPPPPAAKYPIDMDKIVRVPEGKLAPWGTAELSPGYYAPAPTMNDVPDSPWKAPQRPIDVRDVIHVPPGQLAPWGYSEYLPGWYAPNPTSTPGPSSR